MASDTDLSHPAVDAGAGEAPFAHSTAGCERTSRHLCHCGKSFIRKEHLRRHQATHGERNFVCYLCQRSFTRNDLLRRHLARHDALPQPETRRGRACDACHANKTRCDGGFRCTLCSKRDISCTYELATVYAKRDPKKSKDAPESTTITINDGTDSVPEPESISYETTPSSGTLVVSPDMGENPAVAGMSRIGAIISSRASLSDEFQVPSEDKSWVSAGTEEYFGRFHQCWPILHAPSWDQTPPPISVSATVAMVGAWMKSPEALKQPALELHGKMMDRFFEELSNPAPRDLDERPWATELYQAITINIVFAFYHGEEKVVAKAVLLKGMLVSVFREIEFFVCSSAGHQQRLHFPGTFLPWVQSIRERWKRTIVSLYKVDMLLSLSRWQPPTIHREELDVALPSTYALWNAHGLDVFFKRLPREPADRTSYKLSEVICNPNSRARSLLLLEDVQVALCGLSTGIWNHMQISRRTGKVGLESLRTLAWHLETWKAEMERVSHLCRQSVGDEETAGLPFVAYLGRFEDDPARDRLEAMSLIKYLVSEALTLYHIQGLQLYADIRMMSAVAIYMNRPAQPEATIPPRIQNYQSTLHEWAATAESRRALLHAIGVLRLCESDLDGAGIDGKPIDPIAYLAASISALVVWAWVMFAESPCSCLPGVDHINIGVDPPDLQSTSRLENWIHGGGTAAMHGIAFCRCVVDGWMARFGATLPQGVLRWELGDEIAPMVRST